MAVRQKHIFTRNKPLVNIYGGLDNDGKQIEVREDAEQLVKYHEIVELLVGAGYYRAQLQGLTPFDKIVGGMTWCIEICDIDVHVDLLFEEDLTIGKKIALTEKIVAVLPSMKCPHTIEPHQIQGLDFINIHPLIQWLIKYSDEFREAKADELMRFAVAQFDKQFIFKSDRDRVRKQQKISNNVAVVMNMHKPRRERKRTVAMPKNELEQVLLTLSEYGQGMMLPSAHDAADDNKDRDESLELLHDVQKSLADLSQFTTPTNKVQNDQYELTDQDLSDRKLHYAILESELTGEVSSALQESARQKYSSDIENLKRTLEMKGDQWRILKEDLLAETKELEESLGKKREETQHFKACLREIHNTEDGSNLEKDMKEIQAAVSEINKERVDLLNQIEGKSKEFNSLQEEISNLETRQENTEDDILNPEERAAFDEKDNIIGKYLAEQRLRLAKVNQEVLALTSAIDDVPAQIELLQYEKRFLELYDQVAAKHKETKQFYILYNTLFDVKLYVSKELSLLNSILDNYNEAMSSGKKREQFMSQLESIVEWVQQAKSKVERKWGEAREQRERMQRELGALQDVRREYGATLQQLAEQRRNFKELMNQ